MAVHGLATDDAGWLWAATAKGLRIVGSSGHASGSLDSASLVIPDDMRDLTRDGFGRLWALSASSIGLVSPAPKVVPRSRAIVLSGRCDAKLSSTRGP